VFGATHSNPDGRPEGDRRPGGLAGGESRQYGGILFEGGDAHTREAGINIGTIARANAVNEMNGRRSDLTCLGQLALTPGGATMATDASDREQQQRELEEIRRKFTEMGARVGSLFEPVPPDDQHEDVRPTRPALPAPQQAVPGSRPSQLVVAAAVVVLLVGVGLGWLLPHPQAAPPAAASPTTASPAATPTSASAQPRVRTVVPASCLEAARKGDLTIHYLTINVRDRRLVQALKDYTLASQACRREASP
jgi:hypothetical protein